MKSVLISIQPYWVFLIIAKKMGWNIGKEKTVEVRKSYPKDENWDKVAKIYCSKDKNSFAKIPKEYQPFMEQFLGKGIGEFVCDRIDEYRYGVYEGEFCYHIPTAEGEKTCLEYLQAEEYGNGKPLYFWHISDLVIYDKPRELSEFKTVCEEYDKERPKCRGCVHYICEEGNENIGFFEDCYFNGLLPITRPPQSWCYVEGCSNNAERG